MDNSSTLRLAAIAALFLGSIWVLLPTILQADAQSQLSAAASQVEAPSSGGNVHEVVFTNAPDGVEATLQARVDAAGENLDSLKREDGKLVALLRAGTSREELLALTAPGKLGLTPITAADLGLEEPVGTWPGLEEALPQLASRAGAKASATTVSPDALTLPGETSGSLTLAAAPEGGPLQLVTVDGIVVGVGEVQVAAEGASEEDAGPAALRWMAIGTDEAWRPLLAAGPITQSLEAEPEVQTGPEAWMEITFPEGDQERADGLQKALTDAGFHVDHVRLTEKGVVEVGLARKNIEEDGGVVDGEPVMAALDDLGIDPFDASASQQRLGIEQAVVKMGEAQGLSLVPTGSVPPWLAGLLPDTRMALGLDLYGGIDLTLQIGLEEAVLSQASRDLRFFKEQTARDGVEITEAKRSRVEPTLDIQTSMELSELGSWMTKNMPDYAYSHSEGDVHSYAMKEARVSEVQDQAVEQVLETLRKRVNETGVKEPVIVKKGGGQINVQLPGLEDLQSAVDTLGTTAVLEFYLVDEEADDLELDRMLVKAEEELSLAQFEDDLTLDRWLKDQGLLAEDRLLLWQYDETVDGTVRGRPMILKNDVILTGNDVNNAQVSWDQNRFPYVALEFKPRGTQIFGRVTTDNVGKRFAIVLDKEIRSAPNIREKITGGRASIDMGADGDALKDAEMLSVVLRTGSLNAPVDIGQVRTVGSTLGADAIQAGEIAVIVGGVLVLLYMVFLYQTAGAIADVALVFNVFLVLAILAGAGATLTLPGIAGIALTVGMAVDANIIIYERIKEELALGQNPRKAVEAGYQKAVVAVLDANITTAIAGVVLYSYGSGPIKGFAVTLLIGIITTLITALFVTRTFMELLTRSSTARLRIG